MKSKRTITEKSTFACKTFIAVLILTASVAVTARAQGDSDNTRFVNQVFLDLLGRPVDSQSQATLHVFLMAGGNRAQVGDIVLTSQEYRAKAIQDLYGSLLNREPEREEVIQLLNLLNFGGTTEDVIERIAASRDYLTRSGGTSDGFINQLYLDLLGRTARPEEVSNFVRFLLNSGTRGQVAQMITGGREYQARLIAGWCEKFHHRACEPGQSVRFLNLLRAGGSDEQVISILVASDEYGKPGR